MEVPPFDRALQAFGGAAEYAATNNIPLSEALKDFWDDIVWRAETLPEEGIWGDVEFLADTCEETIDWQLQCEDRPEPSDMALAGLYGVEPIPITPEFVMEYVEKMREFALKKNYGAPEDFIDALNFGQLARGVSIMYRVLRPPSESRMGQLGKFGTWVVDRVRRWLSGDLSWREALYEIKEKEGKREGVGLFDIYGFAMHWITASRRARFLTAFTKYFMAQYLAWWACEELEKTPDGLFKLLTKLAEFLTYIDTPIVLGKLYVIYMASQLMNVDTYRNAEANCIMLAAIKPLRTSLEDIVKCWSDYLDEVARDYAEWAHMTYGLSISTALHDFHRFIDLVFIEPHKYAAFYIRYSNATTPRFLGIAYRYLASVLYLPPYRAVAIIRYLRRYGMFPYPEKLLRRW